MSDLFTHFIDALEGNNGWLFELFSIILVVLFVNVILKWVLLKLHTRFESSDSLWKDSFVTALLTPLMSLIWLIALVQLINFTWTKLTNHDPILTPHAIIKVGMILVTSWFLLRWKSRIVKKCQLKSKLGEFPLDNGKVDAINKVLTLVILVFTLFLLLEQFGGSVNTLIAFGGISGLAIAFASQQIIANFFGGILIYFTQPFVVGNWIKLPDKNVEGHVEEIGWYMTRIRAFDKRPIYIPNSMLTNILLMNPSRMTHWHIQEIIFLRYQDFHVLAAIIHDLEKILQKHDKIDQKFPPQVHFAAYGMNGLEIHVSTFTDVKNKYDFLDVQQELLFMIGQVVNKHHADFAIPVTALEFPKGIPH